jgi:hypothetical protein
MVYTVIAKLMTIKSNNFETTETTRVIPQQWCSECAKQTWVVSFEEAFEIWAAGSQAASQSNNKFQLTELHQVQTVSGAKLICLHSLFPNAFSFAKENPR